MQKFIFALCVASIFVPSAAQSQTDIVERALECFNPPERIANVPYRAELEVTLNDKGIVTDLDIIKYEPSDELGRAAVNAASLAIIRCSPYRQPSRKIRAVFESQSYKTK